ncbi:MAG TPA: DUF11 domain-containing protein, partial [Blastocatellia bacterium]|nr:DUF11 domain-containing protein [Blastocatellia bacterium]
MNARLSDSSVRPARKTAQLSAPSKQRLRAGARLGNLRIAALLSGVIAVLTLPDLITCFNVPMAGETAVHAFAESIETFADDCVTPKNSWDLGETACTQVTGAIGDRRIIWIAPDGQIADISPPFNDSGSDTYPLTTTGPFAQYGTWRVLSMDNSGTGFAIASFLVRPANTASADLSVLQSGPLQAFAGNDISYAVRVTNHGPDAAEDVTISVSGPNDSTFSSEVQSSGPTGSCDTPGVGNAGTSTCEIPSLAVGESAVFIFVYTVNAGTPVETLIVNTATVSTSTNELFLGDNQAFHQTAVVGTPPPPQCTINCPGDIAAN